MKQNRVPLTPVLNMDIQIPDEGKAYLVYRNVENAVPASICIFHDGCWIPQTIWEHMNDTLLATFKGVPICKEDMYISIEDAFTPRPVTGDTVDITLKPIDAKVQLGTEVDHEERISKLEEKCDYLQNQIDELREQIKNLPQAPFNPLTPVQPYAPYIPYVPCEPATPYPAWPPQIWYSVKPNWVAPDYTITCTTNFEHSNK